MDAERLTASASEKRASTPSTVRKLWRYCAGTLALVATLSLAGCYGMPLSTREKGTLLGGRSEPEAARWLARQSVLLLLAPRLAAWAEPVLAT